MRLGDVAISYVELISHAAQSLGFDISALLAEYKISQSTMASPDAMVSIPKIMKIGHECIRRNNIPWLGLEMGKLSYPSHMGLSGLLAYSADNLLQSFNFLTSYDLLRSTNVRGQSSTLLEDNRLHVRFYSIDPYNEYNTFVVDSVLSSWYHLARLFCGYENTVDEIHFEFSQPYYYEHYKHYFDCKLMFEQERNQLILKAGKQTLPCLGSCRSTNQMLIRAADEKLNKIRMGQTFSEQVTHAISPQLAGKTPTLEDISAQLNMAPWTVRRKLIADGTSFQQVLNDTRGQLAKTYVCDTTISLGEIAYLIGFSSPAAFQRAFKRWHGLAPGCYREQHSTMNNK